MPLLRKIDLDQNCLVTLQAPLNYFNVFVGLVISFSFTVKLVVYLKYYFRQIFCKIQRWKPRFEPTILCSRGHRTQWHSTKTSSSLLVQNRMNGYSTYLLKIINTWLYCQDSKSVCVVLSIATAPLLLLLTVWNECTILTNYKNGRFKRPPELVPSHRWRSINFN